MTNHTLRSIPVADLAGKIFAVRDQISDLTGERETLRGLRVEIIAFGGMVGEYAVRFVDSEDTIVDTLSQRDSWWTVERVREHLLDFDGSCEFDLAALVAID